MSCKPPLPLDTTELVKYSRAFDPKTGKSEWQHRLKKEHKEYATYLHAKRTLIPVCPGGFRDSGLLTVQSLNTV